MQIKRCLFCDKVVPIKETGEFDRFIGCLCAPDGHYSLRRDSYASFNGLSYAVKAQTFPILSGYIRELVDCGESVALSFDDLEAIRQSPRVPASIEQKCGLLLKYLYRHSEGPGEAVDIRPIADHYNLTYSPNLQELVFIIEKLREEGWMERTGPIFRLTETGWKEAEARASGKRMKPCCVIVPEEDAVRREWTDTALPAIEQLGFFPRMTARTRQGKLDDDAMQAIAESKLVIVELSGRCPETYFAAGYALGLDIPIVCTVRASEADQVPVRSSSLRPIVWNDAAELAELLQQRVKPSS